MKNIGRKEESERVMNKMKTRCQVLYNYRYLIKQLVTKDIKLKYRRSFLGYVWSVLNPLMVMVVMYLVFYKMFRFNIDNYSAYIIAFCSTSCFKQHIKKKI